MYRAYWAIPRTLATSAGEQVNTVFGMASMLLAILKQEEPDALVLCFDAGEETFRHQENATYKEGRAETPDDFYLQIPRVMELIASFGFATVSDARYEADDFLASYAHAAVADGMRVTIVTGDRDAFQLATDAIRIAIPHKGYQQAEYLGPSDILAKYGVRPDQIAAYKGLTGDSSDNLPGVKGIGPKIAASLLQQFDTLERLYDHLDEVASSSVRAKLEVGRDAAFFCQRMAQLVCDIALPLPLTALQLQALPLERTFVFFRAMEFTLLQKRLQSLGESTYGRRAFHAAPSAAADVSTAASGVSDETQLSLF